MNHPLTVPEALLGWIYHGIWGLVRAQPHRDAAPWVILANPLESDFSATLLSVGSSRKGRRDGLPDVRPSESSRPPFLWEMRGCPEEGLPPVRFRQPA